MSLTSVPLKVELMGWNPQNLADYLKKLNLSGCDKVVLKSSITGAQFMQMTESDFQVFPSLYIPKITKLHSEISKDEQNRTFDHRSKTQMFAQEEEDSDSDESGQDSDHDYENGYQEEDEDPSLCALPESQMAEQDNSDHKYGGNDPPSPAELMKPPRLCKLAAHQGCDDSDPIHDCSPAEGTTKPPSDPPPGMNRSAQRPLRAQTGQLRTKRSKNEPATSGTSQRHTKSHGGVGKAPGSRRIHQSPEPAKPLRSLAPYKIKPLPVPPGSTQTAQEPRKGLDPSWYGGKVTRHQAEAALREVNKDGAFVVRDSSGGSADHPYTLMLLKDGKVYNIKIRNQGVSYSLGSSRSAMKSFLGVEEMITHHAHKPLQLTDATDPTSEVQSLCCLLYPAGL